MRTIKPSIDAPLFSALKSGAVRFWIILSIVLVVSSGCAYFVPAMDDSLTKEHEKEKERQLQQQEKEQSSPKQ